MKRIVFFAVAAMFTSSATAQPVTCAQAVSSVQASIGARLIHQGGNTVRLSHPAVREIQIACVQGFASPVDHVWVSAFGSAPVASFDDLLEVIWRASGGARHAVLSQETRDCLKRATSTFGPPEYFSSAKSRSENVDCTYGTIIDGVTNSKISYAVTVKIRPETAR